MKPQFKRGSEQSYLLDEHGNPKIFTTRFSAICKLAGLKAQGYDVELIPGVFYKIAHKQSVGVENPEVIGQTELS